MVFGLLFFYENPLLYMAFFFILSLFYLRTGTLYFQSTSRIFASIFFLLGASLFLSFFFMGHPFYDLLVVGTTSLGLVMVTGILVLYFQRILQERDQVQDQLREESERLSLTLKSITDAMLVTNCRGEITLLNQMALTMIGEREEEALKKMISSLLPVQDEEGRDLQDIVREIKKTGSRTYMDEASMTDREGRERRVSCLASPIFYERGDLEGILFILQDKTKLRETERTLKESERRYRSFVHNFQGIAYRSILGFKPLFFHGLVREITGYESQDFLSGRVAWSRLVHPEDRGKLVNVVDHLSEIEDIEREVTYRIFTRDGEIRYLKDIRTLSSAEEGLCLEGAIYDITELMEIEEQRKEANFQLTSIIESSPLGILSLDQRLSVTSFNQAASTILNLKEEEVIGKSIYSFLSPKEIRVSKIRERIQEGEVITGEEIHIRSWNNQELILNLSAAPLKKTSEAFVGMMAIFMDITHQKRAERLLEENLKKARYLQESLLSKDLPSLSTLEIMAAYRSASHVSGDYYNTYTLGPIQVVLVADVSGHGFDAALITVFISTFFQRELDNTLVFKSPEDLLERFRQEFSRQGYPDDYSVDLFLGFYHEDREELEYAVAGSIRSLKISRDSVVSLPRSSGMPINNTIIAPILGIGSIELDPHEILLIYTDGLDEPFLVHGDTIPLYKTLTAYRELSLKDLLERIILDSLTTIGRDVPDDDMTILGMTRTMR